MPLSSSTATAFDQCGKGTTRSRPQSRTCRHRHGGEPWWVWAWKSSSDRINHNILVDHVRRRIEADGFVRLVRACLKSGILTYGVVPECYQGDGPLSPLLPCVLPEDVAKELERPGDCVWNVSRWRC